ncbi:hypothetical protein T439DRAFT_323950 [Meredithblackwellia eburnea MCA 4105]
MAEPLPFDLALVCDDQYGQILASIKLPEVPRDNPSEVQLPVDGANPFFDSLRQTELRAHEAPVNPTEKTKTMTLTDNGGVTLASTGSPTLDLFVELGSVDDKKQVRKLLDDAWAKDALQTLRIVFQSRSISRGKGKKEPFVQACAWLAERHPVTLLRNLPILVVPTDPIPPPRRKREQPESNEKRRQREDEFDFCEVEEPGMEEKKEVEEESPTPRTHRAIGTYKDALDLLVLSSLPSTSTPSGTELSILGDYSRIPGLSIQPGSPYARTRSQPPSKRRRTSRTHGIDIPTEGKSIHDADRTRLKQTLTAEGSFHRALHLTVVRMFGSQLKQDLNNLRAMTAALNQGMDAESVVFGSRISLAAKWAPSEGQFHDRFTGVASSIAEYLFPIDGDRTPGAVSNCLRQYRLDYLGPLRTFLEIPERLISAGQWDKVKYSRVPSIAMSRLNKHFGRHDAAGFAAYLHRVAQGRSTISGASMTPAVLFNKAAGFNRYGEVSAETDMEVEVAEAQWKALVESIKDEGTLSSCIALADVSGSMWSPDLHDGTAPIDSSLALSILISQVTAAPFNNSIISFTDEPSFIDLPEGLSLREKREVIESRGMGFSTNFIATFQLILQKARDAKLTQEQMPKRVVALSDMEFDEAEGEVGAGQFETHYQVLERLFHEAGYVIPELVFWNLASGQKRTSKPVGAHQKGTVLVSGYSASLVKMFLSGDLDAEEEEEEKEAEVEAKVEMSETGDVETSEKEEDPAGVHLVDDAGAEGVGEVENNGEGEAGGGVESVSEPKARKGMTPAGQMVKALAHLQFRELKVYD